MKSMTSSLALSIFLAAACLTCAFKAERSDADAPFVTEGLQMAAYFDPGQPHAGYPVLLKVSIKNTTTKTIYLGVDGSETDLFKFSVKDAKGREVPLTHWGLSQSKPKGPALFAESVYSRIIGAGQEVHYQFMLNRLFDLSESVTYQVKVTRLNVPVLNGKGLASITSNVARVSIIDPPPEEDDSNSVFHR